MADHKLMQVACETEVEAHYLCGVMNASLVRLVVKGYAMATSTSVHVLEYIGVPKFEPTRSQHCKIANLSRRAHEITNALVAASEQGELKQRLASLETELDSEVGRLWSVSESELVQVRKALATISKIAGEQSPKKMAAASVRGAQRVLAVPR
jgi:DNA gyrase/topoisomerase IV subunit A